MTQGSTKLNPTGLSIQLNKNNKIVVIKDNNTTPGNTPVDAWYSTMLQVCYELASPRGPLRVPIRAQK